MLGTLNQLVELFFLNRRVHLLNGPNHAGKRARRSVVSNLMYVWCHHHLYYDCYLRADITQFDRSIKGAFSFCCDYRASKLENSPIQPVKPILYSLSPYTCYQSCPLNISTKDCNVMQPWNRLWLYCKAFRLRNGASQQWISYFEPLHVNHVEHQEKTVVCVSKAVSWLGMQSIVNVEG